MGSGFGVCDRRANPFCDTVTAMARQLRLESQGGIYHVINRGNDRAAIFATDGASHTFLATLEEVADKLGWRVHAWALMTNHYHVALETPNGNLVDGMQGLQGTFATRFNRLRRENEVISSRAATKACWWSPASILGPCDRLASVQTGSA